MARDDAPPFGRGETFYNGGTIDTSNLGGGQHIGKIWVFEDIDYSTVGVKKLRSSRPVRCMVCRNVSGIALLPKRLANLTIAGTGPTSGIGPQSGDNRGFLGNVDGYTTTTAAKGFPIDEWLPAAGVPNNDLFWVVIDGPATVLTDLAGGANNPISVGSTVVALTAATSQATTAGRVYAQDLTGATAPLANMIQNALGVAMSAKTTANTNADLLVDVRKW